MQRVYPYLSYAGTIPFIFCAFCLILDIRQLPLFGSVEKILSVYALVISSFLAGAHWGQHLQIQGTWSHTLPILSNITAVLLWSGFLILSFKAMIAMFIAAFVILLIIDKLLFQSDLITRQYFQTRCFVSAIVILTLIISGSVS